MSVRTKTKNTNISNIYYRTSKNKHNTFCTQIVDNQKTLFKIFSANPTQLLLFPNEFLFF